MTQDSTDLSICYT